MACPHYNIKISSRANRESVVAQAAYQSGEKLYNERDHRTKNYSRKQGVVYKEIMLPAHAPPEYRDRETLWNAVEKAEQNWNAQLARRFVIALPVELPIERCIDLIREHCRVQFVEEGMIVDIAVHDPDPAGHNPHAHVMLSMRPLDKDGRWMEKAHKEYVLDENGERIRTAGGSWKTRKINTTDWNNPDNARKWRQAWEDLQNRYLEQAGRTERVSLKSYKGRGIEQIPTIHMGPDVAALERKGVQTEIGDLNREIRKTNRFMAALRKYIGELMSWLTEVKAAIAEIEEEPQEIYLVDLLIRRFEERKRERLLTWESSAGMMRADNKDLKRFAEITDYLKNQAIVTVSDLEIRLSELEKSALPIRQELKSVNDQIKGCSRLIESQEQREKLDPVHDAYPIQAYIGENIDMNRANEVRPILRSLAEVAQRNCCAILLVGHLNKSEGMQSTYRGLGSIDLTASARSVLCIGNLKEDPNIRVMTHDKSSLAPSGKSIAFVLGDEDGFRWIGEYEITTDELLKGAAQKSPTKLSEAKEMICSMLAGGNEMLNEELTKEINSKGISDRTIRAAKKALGTALKSRTIEEHRKVYWME